MNSTPVAARSMKDIAPEELLGYLEFHTIGDLRIHKDDLHRIFQNNALDTKKYLPQEIKPHDAYRRATKEAESAISIDYNGQKQKARLLVREVVADENLVERQLVREIVDGKNRRLAYDTVGKFILQRKSGIMDTSWDASYLDEYPYDDHIGQIHALFNEWTQYHTRATVTNIVRRMITGMNHVAIMPNGKATFIPKTQGLSLQSLQGMISDLKDYHQNGGESVIEIIPIIDTIEQRDMVEKRVELQMQNEANELLADFASLLDQDRVSEKVVKRYAGKVVELRDRLDEYEGLIHRKMDTIQDQLADAINRINKAI